MALRLGDTAPDFEADTTHGRLRFHAWKGNRWAILFSHPRDFTPVCTTELGEVASRHAELAARDVKVIGLSVDSVADHRRWAWDIAMTQGAAVNFPVIGDPDGRIAILYDMIHPLANDTSTVRAVFIVDPEHKIRLTLAYPASTGRNFDELVRVIDALQLTSAHPVATPVNWRRGEPVIIVPSLTDAQTKAWFPRGWVAHTPYLRVVPAPRP